MPEKRTEYVGTRLRQWERDAIVAAAADAEVTLSEFVRAVLSEAASRRLSTRPGNADRRD